MSLHTEILFPDILDPKTGRCDRTAAVSLDQLQAWQSGPASKYYDTSLVQDGLSKPIVVFQDLGRKGLNDGYAYTSKPRRHDNIGNRILPGARVLVIFVKPRGNESWWVLDAEWREEDLGKPGFPLQWGVDFPGGIAWQRQSKNRVDPR